MLRRQTVFCQKHILLNSLKMLLEALKLSAISNMIRSLCNQNRGKKMKNKNTQANSKRNFP